MEIVKVCVVPRVDGPRFTESRVICNDSSSVMLHRELRKVQWVEWPVEDPM